MCAFSFDNKIELNLDAFLAYRPAGKVHFPSSGRYANGGVQGYRDRPCRILYCCPGYSNQWLPQADGSNLRTCRTSSISLDDVEEDRIQMNKVARNNLRVKLGDLINIHQCADIKYGKHVHILPFDDSIEGLSGNLFDVHLRPYFQDGAYIFFR